MEIKRLVFIYAQTICVAIPGAGHGQAARTHVTIDLVGGGEEHEGTVAGSPCSLQHVETAKGIHFKVVSRVDNRGSNSGLRREVIDLSRVGGSAFHQLRIANVANSDLQPTGLTCHVLKPFEIVVDHGARQIVEDVDAGVGLFQQTACPVGADKPSAPKYKHTPICILDPYFLVHRFAFTLSHTVNP